MNTDRFFVGLDLGQARDYTALAILERTESGGEIDAVTFARRKVILHRIRHLERLPLGTSYPQVVARVAAVMEMIGQSGQCELIVDATGVGRPIPPNRRRASCSAWTSA